MADKDFVTIVKYGLPQEAYLAKAVLEGRGIRACVVDGATPVWLSYIGLALGGVKRMVAKRDVEKANEALRSRQSQEGSSHSRRWICPHCGAEVDAGFDVCWSCEMAREEDGVAGPAQPFAHQSTSLVDSDQQVGESDDYEVMSAADADAARAWRAAMLGLLFPPFALYSLYLAMKIMTQELSLPATRRFYAALSVSLMWIAVWWWLLFRLPQFK